MHWTLVPLGNPGADYAQNRHNLAQILISRWTERNQATWKTIKKYPSGLLQESSTGVRLLHPSTYMNLSGQICKEWVNYGGDPSTLLILHDEKDLPLGSGRFRSEGSHGGHNGMHSVIDHLGGGTGIHRLRLGIGPFERPLDEFVLSNFTPTEWDQIASMDASFDNVMLRIAHGESPLLLMNNLNGKGFWPATS